MKQKKLSIPAKILREIKRPFRRKKRPLSFDAFRPDLQWQRNAMLMVLSKLTGESMLRVEGTIDEYHFWESVVISCMSPNPDVASLFPQPDVASFHLRLQHDAEVVEPYSSILDKLSQKFPIQDITMLDVGAGPLTGINKLYKGVRFNISAVDALAEYYDNILEKYGVEPPIRTQACKGEEIAQHFSKESFHWINSSNALDHMEFPVECIKGMLPLLKPGGIISLFHYVDVGVSVGYDGFHQWNLHLENNDFCISGRNGKNHTNITKMLLPDYSVNASMIDWLDGNNEERSCLKVVILHSKH